LNFNPKNDILLNNSSYSLDSANSKLTYANSNGCGNNFVSTTIEMEKTFVNSENSKKLEKTDSLNDFLNNYFNSELNDLLCKEKTSIFGNFPRNFIPKIKFEKSDLFDLVKPTIFSELLFERMKNSKSLEVQSVNSFMYLGVKKVISFSDSSPSCKSNKSLLNNFNYLNLLKLIFTYFLNFL